MAQKKINQSLVDYNLKLRELNDIELDVPQQDIKVVLDDPKAYAIDFLEATIVKYVKSYKQAYKLGKELAVENINGKE